MASRLPISISGTIRAKKQRFTLKRSILSRAALYITLGSLVFNQAIYPLAANANPAPADWVRSTRNTSREVPQNIAMPSDIELFEGAVDGVNAMLDDYDRLLPSLDQLADQFGTDPEAAFRYLRDTIRTEPYAGTLRDPSAVIAASGGNTQDKSELLMLLLRKMGLDARIAEMPMNDAILDRLRRATCSIPLASEGHIPELLGLTDTFAQRAIGRAQRDYATLLEASSGHIDAARSVTTDFGSRHYWVQYRSVDGWRDLDPSVLDMEAGDAFGPPVSLSEGGADPHMVTISVVTETLSGGKLRDRTVLSHDIAARDADETPIQIGFTPAGAGLAGVLSDKLGDAIDLAPRIKPTIIIDWQPELGGDFVQPGPSNSGGLGGAQDEDPVTAVWIDIRSTAAGGATRNARRAVIDLLSAADRQAATITNDMIRTPQQGQRYAEELEGMRQIIVSNGGLDPSEYAGRLAFIMASWNEIAQKMDDGTIRPESMSWLAWTRAHGIAIGAERVTRDLRSTDGTICGFSGHANVMTWGIAPKGADTFSNWIDWTIDGIDLTATPASPETEEAAAMRLWYGAVRSAIETEVLAPIDGNLMSTSTLLNGPLERLSDAEVALMDVRSAQEDLDAGYALYGVAGSGLAVPAWWRVDPASGATDARLGDLGNYGVTVSSASVNARPVGGIYNLGVRGEAMMSGKMTRGEYMRGPKTVPTSRGKGGTEYAIIEVMMVLTLVAAIGAFAVILVVLVFASLFFPSSSLARGAREIIK